MSRNFTIDVKNVNDKPSSLELRSVSGSGNLNVSESMQVGEVVGVIVVTDEDMIERITITLDVLEGGVFKLDASGPTCSLVRTVIVIGRSSKLKLKTFKSLFNKRTCHRCLSV